MGCPDGWRLDALIDMQPGSLGTVSSFVLLFHLNVCNLKLITSLACDYRIMDERTADELLSEVCV